MFMISTIIMEPGFGMAESMERKLPSRRARVLK